MRYLIPFLLLLALFIGPVSGQDPGVTFENPEAGFSLMRQFAEDGETGLAIQTGRLILQEVPDYHDVSLYLASVHGYFESSSGVVTRREP